MAVSYVSYIMAVSYIGGGNRIIRRKPPTCRKALTNFIHIHDDVLYIFVGGEREEYS
jgi:hypothetical protein